MKYLQKDITSINRGIIAHGVNCQGAMGSGVAQSLKTKWPKIYSIYMKRPTGASMLGTADIILVDELAPVYVVNCYTQEFYGRRKVKYASPEAIQKA